MTHESYLQLEIKRLKEIRDTTDNMKLKERIDNVLERWRKLNE